MKKIYSDADDVHVNSYIAYGNYSDMKLYLDYKYSELASIDELKEAFEKGLLRIVIHNGDNAESMLIPIEMTPDSITTISKGSSSVKISVWMLPTSVSSGEEEVEDEPIVKE